MGLRHLEILNSFNSESDVYRRQILKYKDGQVGENCSYLFNLEPNISKCYDGGSAISLFKSRPTFSYKLRYIVGFGLVEILISTNPSSAYDTQMWPF